MNRAVRFEHSAQRTKARTGVGEVMKNPGAHDLIKAHVEVTYLLDFKFVDLKIFQVVFSLESLRMAHTRCAAVDSCNLSPGPAQRMLGRLRCPAACDQDGLVFYIRSGRPKQVIVRAASLPVLPELAIFVQIIDRWRIRITVVEVPHFPRYIN